MKLSSDERIEIEVDIDDILDEVSGEYYLKEIIERWPILEECNDDALFVLKQRMVEQDK